MIRFNSDSFVVFADGDTPFQDYKFDVISTRAFMVAPSIIRHGLVMLNSQGSAESASVNLSLMCQRTGTQGIIISNQTAVIGPLNYRSQETLVDFVGGDMTNAVLLRTEVDINCLNQEMVTLSTRLAGLLVALQAEPGDLALYVWHAMDGQVFILFLWYPQVGDHLSVRRISLHRNLGHRLERYSALVLKRYHLPSGGWFEADGLAFEVAYCHFPRGQQADAAA